MDTEPSIQPTRLQPAITIVPHWNHPLHLATTSLLTLFLSDSTQLNQRLRLPLFLFMHPFPTFLTNLFFFVCVSLCATNSTQTRMQILQPTPQAVYSGVLNAANKITTTEGARALWRGVNSVILGAGPAHALYFGTYEYAKQAFGGNESGHHPVAAGTINYALCFFLSFPMDAEKIFSENGESCAIISLSSNKAYPHKPIRGCRKKRKRDRKKRKGAGNRQG